MVKKWVALFILVGFLAGLSGCNTMKGMGDGIKKDLEGVKGVDSWIRDNLW